MKSHVDADVDGGAVRDLLLAVEGLPAAGGEPGVAAGCPLVEVEAAELVLAEAGVVQLPLELGEFEPAGRVDRPQDLLVLWVGLLGGAVPAEQLPVL